MPITPTDIPIIPLPPLPPSTHVPKPTIKLDMMVEEQKEHIEKELKNNEKNQNEQKQIENN